MPELAKMVITRANRGRHRRTNFDHIWQTIGELVIPRKADVTLQRSPGTQRTTELFDSTALEANQRLAASIAGTVTSPVMPWFSIDLPPIARMTLRKIPKRVSQWLLVARDILFAAFQSSNFSAEIEEFYQDFSAFGTAAIFVDSRIEDGLFKGLRFKAQQIGTYSIEEDIDGQVRAIYRDVRTTVRDAIHRFGLENVHENWRKMWQLEQSGEEKPQQGQLDKDITLLHAIWMRREPVNDPRFGRIINRFPVASVWVDEQNKWVLDGSGFQEWPFPVARWSTVTGEEYGRGPGFTALPDTLTVNKADELFLRAAAKAIDPPYKMLHDGVIGRPDFRPSRPVVVTDMNALEQMPPETRMDMTAMLREDKRSAIRRIFFMDQIQFVPERGKTPPSAAEVNARLNIMLQILGPTLSRLEFEALTPIVNRAYGLLSRAGMIPPPPPEVIQLAALNNGDLDVDFVGPISRAKKQSQAASIDQIMTIVSQLGAIKEDAIDVLDWDEALRMRAMIEGVPQNIMNSIERIEQIREARRQAQEQAAQLAQMEQASQVARNTTPLLQGGGEGQQ